MIYMLEDDETIRSFVEYALNNSGFESRGFGHPRDFWKAVDETTPSLVLLDIMLPDEDGLEVLKKLRSRRDTADLPIIMLTAKSTEYDKVIGLDSGADDYISKPFGMMELMSRIKALLRRADRGADTEEYTVGELYVCPQKHIVRAGGEEISLTYKEFELLSLLIRNPGTVFTRDQILQKIWGFEFDGENRTVDVHIRRLREKIEKVPGQPEYIFTKWGVGYYFTDKD